MKEFIITANSPDERSIISLSVYSTYIYMLLDKTKTYLTQYKNVLNAFKSGGGDTKDYDNKVSEIDNLLYWIDDLDKRLKEVDNGSC